MLDIPGGSLALVSLRCRQGFAAKAPFFDEKGQGAILDASRRAFVSPHLRLLHNIHGLASVRGWLVWPKAGRL